MLPLIGLALAACAALLAEAQPTTVGAIYQISQRDQVGYVIASMHGRSPVELELSPRMKEAIAWADVVAFEGIGPASRTAVRRLVARIPGTPPLDEVIPPELLERIRRELDRRGARETHWRRLMDSRIEFARDILQIVVGSTQRSWADPAWKHPGIDMLVQSEAREHGKRVEELEEQTRVLRTRFSLTAEEAIADLERLVATLERDPLGGEDTARPARLFGMLFEGRLEAMYEAFRAASCDGEKLSGVCDKMVDGRNPYLAARIDEIFSSGEKVVAVVGAMHVAGPRSVLAELRSRGYTVRALREETSPRP
jgi:uncharacterized protein YbaP (TraB family)